MSDRASTRTDLVKIGEQTTRLTLAVKLTDTFTQGRPTTDLRVSADGIDVTPVENPSRYHLFLDLPDDPITVAVDGSDRYLDVKETLDPTTLDPPAVNLEVPPSPAYRFPPSATLLRGVVLDAADDPVEDATVSIRHTDRETTTNEDGEFVLFFTNITADDVVRTNDGRQLVKVDGDDPELAASHPDYGSASLRKTVEEKSTTKYEIIV